MRLSNCVEGKYFFMCIVIHIKSLIHVSSIHIHFEHAHSLILLFFSVQILNKNKLKVMIFLQEF